MGAFSPGLPAVSPAQQAPELDQGLQSPMDVVGAMAPMQMSPIEVIEGATEQLGQMHQGVLAIANQFSNMDAVTAAAREVASGLMRMAAGIQAEAEAELGVQDELPPGL